MGTAIASKTLVAKLWGSNTGVCVCVYDTKWELLKVVNSLATGLLTVKLMSTISSVSNLRSTLR